jgi:hypothetical protein
MKPMPETIWAAMREGSSATWFATSTSSNPYLDTIMKTAEPNPTSVWVRTPALFARASRSTPMSAVRSSASSTGGSTAHWSSVDQNADPGPAASGPPPGAGVMAAS